MSDSELDDEEKAQIMAIAMKMANKHDRRKIIDHTFNKYAYTDHPDLPWCAVLRLYVLYQILIWGGKCRFNEDEAKHNRPVLPVTDAEIAEMKKKLKAIDVKTPKKVLEAKARKKRKVRCTGFVSTWGLALTNFTVHESPGESEIESCCGVRFRRAQYCRKSARDRENLQKN